MASWLPGAEPMIVTPGPSCGCNSGSSSVVARDSTAQRPARFAFFRNWFGRRNNPTYSSDSYPVTSNGVIASPASPTGSSTWTRRSLFNRDSAPPTISTQPVTTNEPPMLIDAR
jgi:hypothetical protein